MTHFSPPFDAIGPVIRRTTSDSTARAIRRLAGERILWLARLGRCG